MLLPASTRQLRFVCCHIAEAKPKKKKAERYFEGATAAPEDDAPETAPADKPKVRFAVTCASCNRMGLCWCCCKCCEARQVLLQLEAMATCMTQQC